MVMKTRERTHNSASSAKRKWTGEGRGKKKKYREARSKIDALKEGGETTTKDSSMSFLK